MNSIITRNRRKLTVGAIIGSILGVSGIAIAAILLTTTITGTIAYGETTVSSNVGASDAEGTGGVTCSATDDGTAVALAVEIKTITGGGQTQSVPGSCEVAVTVGNNGGEPVTVNGGGLVATLLPQGFGFVPGDSVATIAPGSEANFTGTLNVGADATNTEATTLTLKVDVTAGG